MRAAQTPICTHTGYRGACCLNTSAIGRRAEQVAAAFLVRKGCQIIAANWRTRYCEIDIVAYRDSTVYFCEVKYRATATQGTGLEYITPAKLRQMHFAAEMWVHAHSWQGDYEVCAIEVSGASFAVTGVAKDL